MKTYNGLLMVLLIGLCSACSQNSELDIVEKEKFRVLITVEQMVGEEMITRTFGSMTPNRENSIKSLSVFQFDMEGELRRLKNNDKRYIYQKFTNLGDPNGIPYVTESNMDLSPLQSDERMYTCLIANIDEELLYKSLFPNGEDDPVTWAEFQALTFSMPFASADDIDLDATLERGHLTSTYMFGIYDGKVPDEGFTIGLGRILTRLKINFNFGEVTNDMNFYAAVENLEKHAYFSVAEDSPHEHYSDPRPYKLDRDRFDLTSTGVNEGKSILQFYCAPHVGTRITADNCTCLYLWCVKGNIREKEDSETEEQYNDFMNRTLQKKDAARIPLCADYDNGQYHLARNTFYSFNINLTPTEN